MSDDRHHDLGLSGLLRDLPREAAGDEFTASVVEAVRRSSRVARGRLVGLGAAAAALGAVLVVTLRPADRRQAPPHPSDPQIAAITQEYTRLEAEWEALNRLRAAARPVVYLGATERADLVLDLEQLARRRAGARGGLTPRPPGLQPVAFTHGERQP